MTCLNESQIQAVADREAAPDLTAHVEGCGRCAERVRECRRRTSALEATLAEPSAVPPPLAARVRGAIEDGSARGATRLRHAGADSAGAWTASPFWLRAGWSTAAVIAAAIVAFVFVIPAVRGPETVSAAGILAESASRLSQVPQSGVEIREYELALDGVPRELMREVADGVYRIRQAIDHGKAGRFRFASYTADGRLLTSIAQDPVTRSRVTLLRIDDQYYRFEFIIPPGDVPSLPELERLHMEASISMMRASGQQMLAETTVEGRKSYVIEVPQVSAPNERAVWDLTHARVLVDAEDYRVTELEVSGTFLKQPYSVSYKLIHRALAASVDPATFDVPSQPGEIIIAGDGTANPAGDMLMGALRELARLRSLR
jgi:hypothetical protein